MTEPKGFTNWSTCFYCGKEFDDADVGNFNPPVCCSGYQCGCMGLPTEPPYCVTCGQDGESVTDNKQEDQIMQDCGNANCSDYDKIFAGNCGDILVFDRDDCEEFKEAK